MEGTVTCARQVVGCEPWTQLERHVCKCPGVGHDPHYFSALCFSLKTPMLLDQGQADSRGQRRGQDTATWESQELQSNLSGCLLQCPVFRRN